MRQDYEREIFEALGKASVCWNPRPGDQVFDSEEASKIGVDLVEYLESNVPLGIVILSKALKDSSYYYSWQANIAMAFKDEMERYYKTGDIDREAVHTVANQAAKNFLNMFLYKPISDGE